MPYVNAQLYNDKDVQEFYAEFYPHSFSENVSQYEQFCAAVGLDPNSPEAVEIWVAGREQE